MVRHSHLQLLPPVDLDAVRVESIAGVSAEVFPRQHINRVHRHLVRARVPPKCPDFIALILWLLVPIAASTESRG